MEIFGYHVKFDYVNAKNTNYKLINKHEFSVFLRKC